MLNYISQGKTVSVKVNPNLKQVKSGDPVRVNSLFGIAATSVLKEDPRYPFGNQDEDREYELYVEGIFEIKSDESKFETGEKVYFDPVSNRATATTPDPAKKAASTFLIGVATEDIKRSDSMLRVRLNGVSI